MIPDWLTYVDTKRRTNLVTVLEALSALQNKENLDFIIIGALPLLVGGYLTYKVYWDLDLLFKNEETLQDFVKKPKNIRIVDYDDTFMVGATITSFHTAWKCDGAWFNVDYILQKGFFEFYTHTIESLTRYTADITMYGEHYTIDLCLAHPWDVLVGKIVSPRTDRDVELKIDTSIDIRHIFAVYNAEKDNRNFWRHVEQKSQLLGTREFVTKFQRLLALAGELGYSDIVISPLFIDLVNTYAR